MEISKKEKFFLKKYGQIIGIDEAGRGAWAGPLVLASVILNKKSINFIKNNIDFKLINDSKKLPAKKRMLVYSFLKNKIAWHTYFISQHSIDKYGLSKAIDMSLLKLVKKTKKTSFFLTDKGLNINNKNIKYQSFVKGDEKFFSIALASIVAKVSRDNYMEKISKAYPNYCFESHKGYGTKAHLKAIKKHRPSKIHRFSYKPVFELATFKQKIFFLVSRIPRGKFSTYKEIAEKAGKPKAWRAVGNILNKNFDKKIPCHRVIKSNKKIGGYNRGISNKIKLLKKEGLSIEGRKNSKVQPKDINSLS